MTESVSPAYCPYYDSIILNEKYLGFTSICKVNLILCPYTGNQEAIDKFNEIGKSYKNCNIYRYQEKIKNANSQSGNA